MAKTANTKDNLMIARIKRGAFIRPIVWTFVLLAVAGLGFKLWQNPTLINQLKDWIYKDEVEHNYQQQIDEMAQQLALLRGEVVNLKAKAENPDFSEMNKRIDNIEQINVNTIKSKADVETVLGLVVRMDNAEAKIRDLAKVSDQGALILTAAMLVKDAAERGGKFVYEAEILNELAKGDYAIENDVARIYEIAQNGVPDKQELKHQFSELFAAKYGEDEAELSEANNWKDRIYQQVNKVVQIKKVSETSKEPEFSEEDRAWSVLNDMVARGELEKALAVAQKPLNADLFKDEEFGAWIKNVEIYKDFYDSVNRISAKALAVMKVKFMKAN